MLLVNAFYLVSYICMCVYIYLCVCAYFYMIAKNHVPVITRLSVFKTETAL